MTGLTFRSFAVTHPGTRRTLNEDSFVNRPDIGLWAVADGVGGAEAGEVASAAIRDALMAIPAGLHGEEVLDQVRRRAQSVHRMLRDMAAERDQQATIASTVVALIAAGGDFVCLWAGDSRAYVLHAGALVQLTEDHSLVQAMVAVGAITEAEAVRHPQANVITRAVGAGQGELELDKRMGTLHAGDRFLLCSDGLSKTLSASDMATLLGRPEGAASNTLLEAALAQKASDNVTVVTVEVWPDRPGSGS
jgi:protein phosphatase/serine/threonine-protein phosphatase Stp1